MPPRDEYRDKRECHRYDREKYDVAHHTLRFDGDRDPVRRPLCPVCVRRIRDQPNEVRSITN